MHDLLACVFSGEPYALIALVRVCGGALGQLGALPGRNAKEAGRNAENILIGNSGRTSGSGSEVCSGWNEPHGPNVRATRGFPNCASDFH